MLRFDGDIAGVGTSSGVRVVLGMWAVSPFGPIADAMVELPSGRRVLIAPTAEVADFIAGTYRFDEVRVEQTGLWIDGAVRTFVSASLRLSLVVGPRTLVGRILVLVPRRLARARWWCALLDPFARTLRRGVRTVGSAGGGRREWYCALDEHRLRSMDATWDGASLGGLTPVTPPVHFGFASAPAEPSLVRVTTWIRP